MGFWCTPLNSLRIANFPLQTGLKWSQYKHIRESVLFIPEFDISEYQYNFCWAVIIVSPKTITRMLPSRIVTACLHIL